MTLNKLLNHLVGQPVILGKTDCNTMMCLILDSVHGTKYHEQYTSKITKKMMREVRARDVLTEVGYSPVADRPRKGDFLIRPAKYRDNVFFVYSPMKVITALKNLISNKNKVRTMLLEEIDEQVMVWRKI